MSGLSGDPQSVKGKAVLPEEVLSQAVKEMKLLVNVLLNLNANFSQLSKIGSCLYGSSGS